MGNSFLKDNLKWFFFITILLVSILPTIKLYQGKQEEAFYDAMNSIVYAIAISVTIGVFVINVLGVTDYQFFDLSFNAVLNAILVTLFRFLPFVIYPYTVAFAMADFFIKL